MNVLRHSVMEAVKDGEAGGGGTPDDGGGVATDRNYEEEASRMGWVPQDKWTQDPERWVDAQEFVERGEKVLPIILGQKRALENKVKELEKAQQGADKDIKEFKEFLERQTQAEINRRLAEVDARRTAAVSEADGEAFAAAEAERKAIEAEAAKRGQEEEKRRAAPPEDPDYQPWLKENPWYANDIDLQIAANAIGAQIVHSNPSMHGRPLFEEVKRRVAEIFPAKFSNPINRGGTVERSNGGEGGGFSRRNGHTYNDLPQEAKAACEKFIAKGWIEGKDIAAKRQAYVDAYQWD